MLKTLTIQKAPEIQTMYSLNIPVSEIRTKIRQEHERHRFVNKLSVVDMLIFQSDAEYQVRVSILNTLAKVQNIRADLVERIFVCVEINRLKCSCG